MADESTNVSMARYRYIVKSNDMIQKARFNLSNMDQRIILYLISKINRFDSELKPQNFFIRDFCRVCGIDIEKRDPYIVLKDTIQTLADKSIWMPTETGSYRLFRWITEAEITPNNGMITIQLNKELQPYLIHLNSNFTRYELINILRFRNKYSTRLYELLKSLHYKELETYHTRVFTLDELRDQLGVYKMKKDKIVGNFAYKDWQALKQRVIEPAIKEINEYSDIIVSYKTITRKRSVPTGDKAVVRSYVYGLEFMLDPKEVEDRAKTYAEDEENLGFDQLTFGDNWDDIQKGSEE